MDARNLEIEVIKEGISKGCYEITGILETGEVVLALITEQDKRFIENILDEESITKEMIIKLMKIKGRPALELMQVYKQKFSKNSHRLSKNNLIFRKI